MNSTNTKKGLIRNISHYSSLPVVLSEGGKDMDTKFDFNSLLTLYNGGFLQVSGINTNDNQIHEIPFLGSLIFSQNREPFPSTPIKERVISIKFMKEELNGTTSLALSKLKQIPRDQTANIGKQVLCLRKTFEKSILLDAKAFSIKLKNDGVSIERIADNYAIPLAAFAILSEQFKLQKFQEVYSYALNSAKDKLLSLEEDNDLAEAFFDTFHTLVGQKDITEGEHYIKEEGNLYLRLTEITKIMKEKSYPFAANSSLNASLKDSTKFIKASVDKRSKNWKFPDSKNSKPKCWVFKIE